MGNLRLVHSNVLVLDAFIDFKRLLFSHHLNSVPCITALINIQKICNRCLIFV